MESLQLTHTVDSMELDIVFSQPPPLLTARRYQSREIERPADLGYLEGGLGIASLRAPSPKRRHCPCSHPWGREELGIGRIHHVDYSCC